MEKISFPPLIAVLRDNSALYNQWYNESEMKYGSLPSHLISSWMTEVVEPIVKTAFALNDAPEKTQEIVKALYQESLKLISTGTALRYREEYKESWLLLVKMPSLVVKFPTKVISLLNDVLVNLHLHAPEKTIDWCSLMETSTAEIKTIEDFKIAGRIYAWKCGLAHLRIRLKADFAALSENLQQTIVNSIGSSKDTSQLFESPWASDHTKFEGIQGGFIGTAGFFEQPPLLAQLGEHIFVTDSKSSYALFADQFGKVLIPANTVDAQYIVSNSKQLDTAAKLLRKESTEIDVAKISSAAATQDTLVFTMLDSYFIYLYSLGNA